MEDRTSLVAPAGGRGPDFTGRTQPESSRYSFQFEDAQNNPIGVGNIEKSMNGGNLNELVQSPWSAPIFLGTVVNNRALSTKMASNAPYEIAGSPAEVINPQVNGSPVLTQVASRDTNMLEDYLVHAGVADGLGVQEDPLVPQPVISIDPMSMFCEQQGQWAQLQSGFDVSQSSNSVLVQGICNTSPDSMSVAGGDRKKSRILEENKDKSIERRQRRMIKNRESAARSRAKKQVENRTQSCGDFAFCLMIQSFRESCLSLVL